MISSASHSTRKTQHNRLKKHSKIKHSKIKQSKIKQSKIKQSNHANGKQVSSKRYLCAHNPVPPINQQVHIARVTSVEESPLNDHFSCPMLLSATSSRWGQRNADQMLSRSTNSLSKTRSPACIFPIDTIFFEKGNM